MKRKTLSLTAAAVVLLFASSSIASTNPVISSSSENSVRISSARVVRALGGGSYVTGMAEPSFGYVAPHAAHVHVAAYDANGKLLAEKIDKINGNNLVRWHLRPRPRAPYTVFFVWEPSQIAKVTVIEHRGDTHPASSRTTIARQNGHNAEGNPAWLAKALVRAEVRFQIQDHQTGDPLEVKE